jgi:preprotein translocase subunit YajC
MSALWLMLVPVVLIGGFFLIRSLRMMSKSMKQLRLAMDDLAQAGAALNKVQEEVAKLGATVDEVRRR